MFAPFAFRQEVATGGGGPAYVTADLYSYYDPFDSVLSGATLTDLSGNGRTGTLIGTWSTDSEGFVFTTRGSSAPYMTFSSFITFLLTLEP